MRTFFFSLLLFIVGCCHANVMLYAQENQDPALTISNGPMTKLGVAISPDGRTLIATGSGSPVLFDAVTGDSLRTFDGFTTLVYAAAWSPDGRRLLISSIRRAIIVGTDDWEVELDLGADSVRHQYSAMWSSDGSMVAFGDFEGVARIWDATTGTMLHSHAFGGAIRDVQFMGDDSQPRYRRKIPARAFTSPPRYNDASNGGADRKGDILFKDVALSAFGPHRNSDAVDAWSVLMRSRSDERINRHIQAVNGACIITTSWRKPDR